MNLYSSIHVQCFCMLDVGMLIAAELLLSCNQQLLHADWWFWFAVRVLYVVLCGKLIILDLAQDWQVYNIKFTISYSGSHSQAPLHSTPSVTAEYSPTAERILLYQAQMMYTNNLMTVRTSLAIISTILLWSLLLSSENERMKLTQPHFTPQDMHCQQLLPVACGIYLRLATSFDWISMKISQRYCVYE